jgi:hypothetical protein
VRGGYPAVKYPRIAAWASTQAATWKFLVSLGINHSRMTELALPSLLLVGAADIGKCPIKASVGITAPEMA